MRIGAQILWQDDDIWARPSIRHRGKGLTQTTQPYSFWNNSLKTLMTYQSSENVHAYTYIHSVLYNIICVHIIHVSALPQLIKYVSVLFKVPVAARLTSRVRTAYNLNHYHVNFVLYVHQRIHDFLFDNHVFTSTYIIHFICIPYCI